MEAKTNTQTNITEVKDTQLVEKIPSDSELFKSAKKNFPKVWSGV